MAGIAPVPNSRIPGLLARQRLTQQYQTDQLDLFRLQEQISTGLRITLPSEDAPAALRAISFQRLLERKEQLGSNISSGLLFLGNTDAALGGQDGVADALNKIKADTLGAVETVATDQQRQAAISKINGALERLVTLGNRQFNGRYLFAGSQTDVQPYSFENGNVLYHGDDREIENFLDIGVLFSSSISGQEVFGGISAAVEGQVDLNPPVSADTLLSSLRGGRGINPNGSLQITDSFSNSSSIVDISDATTIGDVVRLIEDNPPPGTIVYATVTNNGIQVALEDGTLSIEEVGAGTTARELGLLVSNISSTTRISEDLDPQLLKTTRLEDLLGSKARASLQSAGDNNDILIEASANGTALDGVAISVVNGGAGSPLSVAFNGGAKTLVITVDDGATTAQEVVDAINADGNFSASVNYGDASTAADAGSGFIDTSASATTSGGTGETLDLSSGIQIVNGGETYEISFDGDSTVEDILNRLNRSEAGVQAEINEAGTGINIRSRFSGSDFAIGENGGTTATQLGIRSYSIDSKLSEFNFGSGVPISAGFEIPLGDGVDLTINSVDGIPIDVNLSNVDLEGLSATDAITAIANAINTANGLAGANVTASAVTTGNVTTLRLDDAGVFATPLSVTSGAGSLAAEYLGLVDNGTTQPVTTNTSIVGNHTEYVQLSITDKAGQTYGVDISGAETVGDVLSAINVATGGNAATGGNVDAQLATVGNGIELVDQTGGVGDLVISSVDGSRAAEFLGLIDKDQTSSSTSTTTLTGTDRNARETDSVFNSLIRLRDALAENDLPQISRAAAKLEDDIDRVTFAQADVGSRFLNLKLAENNLQDEEIQIKSALSEEVDVDLVQAISDLTARQISLEASLRATANILQLSLLNFI